MDGTVRIDITGGQEVDGDIHMPLTICVALGLCIIEFLVIVIASPMAKPSLVLRFLPEDVRLKAKDHKEPPKSKQMMAHVLLVIFLASMIGGIVYLGMDGARQGYGFWKLTLRYIVLLYVMKVYDIIVQDQWLVMTFGYFKKIFPETVDCEGWKDRGFNNKKQIIRIFAYPFLSMIMAGLFILLCK